VSRQIVKAAVFVGSVAIFAALVFALVGDRDIALRENGSFVVSAYGLDGHPPQYESLFLASPGGTALDRISNRTGLYQPAWSPDGTRIAFIGPGPGRTGDIYVIDADGSALRSLTMTRLEEATPSWSPDGKRIAFVREGDVWVMDADGSGQAPLLETEEPGHYQAWPSWSPDGTKIAFVRPFDRGIFDTCPKNTGTGVFVMDANGSEPRRLTIEGCRHRVAWSPSGEQLAIIGARGWVKVLDTEGVTTDSFRPPDLPPDQIGFVTAGPVWSPDGKFLGVSLEGNVWTLDVGSRAWRQVTRDTGFSITDLDWGPSPGATVVP
jgi:dipeptidyl aminopeptidase/acylaminoacyl peptidase